MTLFCNFSRKYIKIKKTLAGIYFFCTKYTFDDKVRIILQFVVFDYTHLTLFINRINVLIFLSVSFLFIKLLIEQCTMEFLLLVFNE